MEWCTQCGVDGMPRPATGIDEDGSPACPAHRVDQFDLSENQPQPNQTKNGVVGATSSCQENQVETTEKGKRICKVSECLAELGPANRSGYCAMHRHLGDPRRRKSLAPVSSKPLGTSARKKDTASVRMTGAATLARSSDNQRLDQFLMTLPTADKIRIIDAWFCGRI